ncbi:hypothetical protein [Streptomyces pratens]
MAGQGTGSSLPVPLRPDGEHALGGIYRYGAAATTDESPVGVALIQRLSSAFPRSALYPEDTRWKAAATALDEGPSPLGTLRHK